MCVISDVTSGDDCAWLFYILQKDDIIIYNEAHKIGTFHHMCLCDHFYIYCTLLVKIGCCSDALPVSWYPYKLSQTCMFLMSPTTPISNEAKIHKQKDIVFIHAVFIMLYTD